MFDKGKNKFTLSKIQKTMILPLWGRYLESKKEDPLLFDAKAIEIIDSIDYDFSNFRENLTEYNALAFVIRAKAMDEAVRGFLKKHPEGTIVNIGAGLDTTLERVDNGRLTWYDLDLPDGIEFRKKYIPETGRSRCISKSVFDYTWLDDIKVNDNVLFTAAGVLMFFGEEQIKELFSKLAERFPNGEIFFNVLSKQGLEYSNTLMKNAGMADSLLSWGVNAASEITQWNENYVVMGEFPYFKNIPRKNEWSDDTIKYMDICDEANAQNFFHIKFK